MDIVVFSKEEFDSFRNEIIQEVTRLVNSNVSQDIKPWLRTKDVCRLLNLSSSSLQNLRNNGIIPFKKLNGTILYKRSDIEGMLSKLSEGGEI